MNLETLPKGLGKLISLRQMYITTKQSVLSLNEFASLSNLQTLSFEYCDNLEVLLGEVQLASLEALIVRSCGSLTSLPFCNLSQLEALLVIDCMKLELRVPENLQNTIKRWRMSFLHVENFPGLQWIEGAAETLQTLIIINIPMLWKFPDCLTKMTRRKMLHVADCPLLDCLPSGIQCLTALDTLTIDGCPKLCRKCKPHSGEYWPVISHIKRVSIGEPKEQEINPFRPVHTSKIRKKVPQEGEGSLFSNNDLLI
ncbi:putative disease resistance protein RGA3-like, partial [Trifolium medium]|nr:putative disease resistance protein RGA3-like [Trifolium medium]